MIPHEEESESPMEVFRELDRLRRELAESRTREEKAACVRPTICASAKPQDAFASWREQRLKEIELALFRFSVDNAGYQGAAIMLHLADLTAIVRTLANDVVRLTEEKPRGVPMMDSIKERIAELPKEPPEYACGWHHFSCEARCDFYRARLALARELLDEAANKGTYWLTQEWFDNARALLAALEVPRG